ncbi:winged helix-turn-helix domain-containing protein [uncultured Tateyamaria sp.]|uniref:winged helix-turn-helix domain-containing protein n=1 Tax=uncultured Tateyamaria sp. TaxID=455651 RepID=UPI00262BA8FC|nr:winged helix-turn-helix domain-containing protein [uncultured Tateyamaria sp.]
MEYGFGPYALDVRRLQLVCDGAPVPTEPQVFALLRHLIENRDRVVSRDEIFEVIWKDRIVSDAALSSRIKAARAAIGDDGSRQALVRTVHGRGFQFVGEIEARNAETSVSPAAAQPSLAVMPTAMVSPTDAQRAFGEGLEDDISAAIGRIGTIYVARHTGDDDAKCAAERLGVRYVLGVKLRFAGDAFRLNASLLHAERMEEVWADRFEGQLSDPFAAQDQVLSAVLGRLVPNIMMVEVQRAMSEATATDAYHELLRATPLCMSMDATDNRQAVTHLERALAADPDHALSHAMLSWSLGQQALSEWAPDRSTAFARAMEHGRRALSLAPMDALVLTFVASAEVAAGEHVAARHHLDTALDLDPSLAWAWAMLGALETYSGRLAEAIANYERALRLSPHDPMRFSYYFGIGAARYGTGDYAGALPLLEQGYLEAPGSTWAPRLIMACAVELGLADRMAEVACVVRSLKPNATAEELVDSAPIRDAGYRERLAASFRKAGF